MGVETGLILAVSIVVLAAFAAPWLWPAIDRSSKTAQPERQPKPTPAPVHVVDSDPAPFEIDRDEVVLRLRSRGLTYRRIAERLSDDFGQHMSESTARRIWMRESDRRHEAGARSHGGRRTTA
jgi:hypothetical protein